MKNHQPKKQASRRHYPDDLKHEAVQMLLDGHSAETIVANLGISHSSVLYRWKAELLAHEGPAASALEQRVRQLEEQLRRTERERDILKKALAIFSQHA